MSRFSEFNIPRRRGGLGLAAPEVGVHVLSEHVFCPRAALLAIESGDDAGEEGLCLGQRLDGFHDYDDHRFAEGIHSMWGDLRLWSACLVPALILVAVVWRSISPQAAVFTTLPIFYLFARIWDTGMQLITLIRERAILRAAQPASIDLGSQQIREVNWWSLRKAGFDCVKPPDAYRDHSERLTGKPWRVLTKDTKLRIPVIRKHHGERVWRPQHAVRVAAYCRLIEVCEGGVAPFGIILFAGSYDCVIIPNTAGNQAQFHAALEDVREFLAVSAEGRFVPKAPTDNRCAGCPFGEPREYARGYSDTVLNGNVVEALRTKGPSGRTFHCTCGDKFVWVPPHDAALLLRLTERR
jgi:hypothetical protein